MKFHYTLLLLLSHIFVACSTANLHGFQAAVSVNTSGHDPALIRQAKSALAQYVEGLGLREYTGPTQHVIPPNYVHYRHPKYNTVFYNLYLENPEKISIIIRDVRRTYNSSEELREEIEGLLYLLKKYFDEDKVKFEQQSTFLS